MGLQPCLHLGRAEAQMLAHAKARRALAARAPGVDRFRRDTEESRHIPD